MRIRPDVAVVGMGVMGRNLAMNMLDRGYAVAIWNRSPGAAKEVVALSQDRLIKSDSLRQLCQMLKKPRRIIFMIPAGVAVDEGIEGLIPWLESGDILMDGGNSHFFDTERRCRSLAEKSIHYLGVGISGGEKGARHGPSIMPGGSIDAYSFVSTLFEDISAKTEFGPCVSLCGRGGAGHFVKMVHNGIEYADMQIIAEAYDLLKRLAGLTAPEIAGVFDKWNEGDLASYLVEITSKILRFRDPNEGGYLVDRVLDKAGQKGTGKWTSKSALDLGVSVPTIGAAVDARLVSAMKDQRVRSASDRPAPKKMKTGELAEFTQALEAAVYVSKVLSYAQGMGLIRTASIQYDWSVDLEQMARIWTGGCIIRAKVLEGIMKAYAHNPSMESLMAGEEFKYVLAKRVTDLRKIVVSAAQVEIPVPALSASLSYYDAYHTAVLPQNLIQAQRDAFGAHTYQRNDQDNPPFVHSAWLVD